MSETGDGRMGAIGLIGECIGEIPISKIETGKWLPSLGLARRAAQPQIKRSPAWASIIRCSSRS